MNSTALKAAILNVSFLLLFSMCAEGQDAGRRWISFSSPKGDLTLAMPVKPSVSKDSEMVRVFCNEGGATLDFQVRPRWNSTGDALKYLGQEFDDSGTVEIRDFKVGKVNGRARVRNADYYSISIYFAGKNIYQITASADGPDNAVLKGFLSSIRIDGQPLTTRPGIEPVDPTRIDSLDTSLDVKDALKTANANNVSVTYDSAAVLNTLNPRGPYSRMALVLQKPRPTYTDAARQANVQGDIVLYVKLKADGSVGDITVRKKLPNGLTETAIAAAKRVKFLTAQKDNKSVDFYVPLTYSFTIY
jgi:TonB family protein